MKHMNVCRRQRIAYVRCPPRGTTVIFGFDFAAAATLDGVNSVWSVREDAAGGLYCAGDDVWIWCVLLFGAMDGGIRPKR